MALKIFLVMGLLLFSCNKKVDCEKIGNRVLSCESEFGKRLNPGKKIDKTRFKELLQTKFVKSCKSRGGNVGDAKKINRCLKSESCVSFVDCILEKK